MICRGPESIERRLGLYAHYDREGLVRPYVLHALQGLREVCSEIHFVSTALLSAEERSKLEGLCAKVVLRENRGFDFGMWAEALRQLNPSQCDEVLLANSSVLGPVFPLGPVFEAAQALEAEFWGLTENHELARHVQSYFLVFRRRVLESPAFAAFWSRILDFREKEQMIRAYEVGLTRFLEGEGFRGAALFPRERLAEARGRTRFFRHRAAQNPTLSMAAVLLDLGMPFVKAELLARNPRNEDLDAVLRRLQRAGFPLELVQDATGACELPEGGMRRVRRGNCFLCGSAGRLLYTGLHDMQGAGADGTWNLKICPKSACGLVWVDPAPFSEDLHLAYRNYYTAREGRNAGPRPHWLQRKTCKWFLRQARRLGMGREREWLDTFGLKGQTPGRLLEVGCGSGSRLAALRQMGWSAEGQDVDPAAVAHARETHGLEVHLGPLEELSLPEGSFDVVALSHVLEHALDPVSLLEACRRVLKLGGRLVLVTPNVRSLLHRYFKRNCFLLDPPRHIHLFNRRSLTQVVERAGFEVHWVQAWAAHAEIFFHYSEEVLRKGATDADYGHSMPAAAAYQLWETLRAKLDLDAGSQLVAQARRPVS
jgi:SAM-dependent methyltransferase